MENLTNPRKTIEILQNYHFSCRKKYGQNFLIDAHVLDRILKAAGITKRDCVLEIGPGIGTLTQRMAEICGRVVAVEIDQRLIPILRETLNGYDNVILIQADILKLDLQRLAAEQNDGRPFKVVANLPYYITTPIIMDLLENHAPVSDLTVMVQEEVAARMQAQPGSGDYGALSLAVQYYARPSLAATVPPDCFLPRPSVNSALMHLERREPPVQTQDVKFLFDVIRAAFQQRRKTLLNALDHAPEITISREQIREAMGRLGLPPGVRGETLSLEQFAQLAELLA